jgi:hypothetical protein
MILCELHDFGALALSVGFLLVLDERSSMNMTTPLVSQPANAIGGVGFVTREQREIIKIDGTITTVPAGTKIYISRPGTLYQGSDIGGPRAKGVYVLVGLRSPVARYATGYMALSNIANPANIQARVPAGAAAQQSFITRLQASVGEGFKLLSVAPMSSQAPDVIAQINQQTCQFEIKGRNNQAAHITFFDRSIRRGNRDPMLDDVARALMGSNVDSFEQMIDIYRKKNTAVGFPGDKGAPPSGKLPPEFRVHDNPALFERVRAHLLAHFNEAGDNYFAVLNRDDGKASIFWTGTGPNPLEAPDFPQLTMVLLDTYGGAYKGAMRVALKVRLDPSVQGLQI